jgi:hypothetical protein
MAQVLQKSYDCLTCHKQIRIAKIDNVPAGQKKKWESMNWMVSHYMYAENSSQNNQQPQKRKAAASCFKWLVQRSRSYKGKASDIGVRASPERELQK